MVVLAGDWHEKEKVCIVMFFIRMRLTDSSFNAIAFFLSIADMLAKEGL